MLFSDDDLLNLFSHKTRNQRLLYNGVDVTDFFIEPPRKTKVRETVTLPCSIGDTVYFCDDCKEGVPVVRSGIVDQIRFVKGHTDSRITLLVTYDVETKYHLKNYGNPIEYSTHEPYYIELSDVVSDDCPRFFMTRYGAERELIRLKELRSKDKNDK